MYPFPFRAAVTWTPADRRPGLQDIIESDPERTYGVYAPELTHEDVEAAYDKLCRQTPSCVAIYTSSASGYNVLYARPGCEVRGFRPFAAVRSRAGWQVLQPPTEAFRASKLVGHAAQARLVYEAPAWLSPHTPLAERATPWESLFASFLSCAIDFAGLFDPTRPLPDSASVDTHRQVAAFVQRQDLIHLHGYGTTLEGRSGPLDLLTEAMALQARAQRLTLPAPRGCLRPVEVPKLSPAAQLGLLRCVTAAHVAIYAAAPEFALLVKTHERFGEARGKTRNFAAACTERGWQPIAPEVAFGDGRDHLAAAYLGSHQISAEGPGYATLFEAFVVGGGVRFDIPTALDAVAQRRHLDKQVDALIARWRACLALQSAASAEAWGHSFAARVPASLMWVRKVENASTPSTLASRHGAPTASNNDQALWDWFHLTMDDRARIRLMPTRALSWAEACALDVDHQGHHERDGTPPRHSPRPPPRRLTWPGRGGNGSNAPRTDGSLQMSSSPERNSACP